MRVVHLGKYYPPATGGIESHTQALCRSLATLGVDVRVVVVNHQRSDGKDVTFSRTARTPTVTDTDGPIRIWRAGRVANLAKLDVTPGLLRILREIERDPPDLWHLHAPNVTMILALAGMPRLRPLVITHHSDIIKQKVLKYPLQLLERGVYQRAAKILPASPTYISGSDTLRKYLAKVAALPLGIDLQPFLEPSPETRLQEEELRRRYPGPRWLCCGRLVYYKALDVAIRALVDLPGTLMVVGNGPMKEAWVQLSQSLGVAERVIWRGNVSAAELMGAYRAATAFWFPSNARSEGFGLVQVEAMASGCPVINAAIPHSGVTWVSRHDESGLTVPINDVPAWVASARRLLNEPGLHQRLSQGAQARARSEFDQAVMGRRCLEIYTEALQEGSSDPLNISSASRSIECQ